MVGRPREVYRSVAWGQQVKPVILVLYSPSYGRDLFEPLNGIAKQWAREFGTEGFTRDALRMLELKGYDIKILQKEVKL